MKKFLFFIIVCFFCSQVFVIVYGSSLLFREDFNSLSMWDELKFPKIKVYTKYSIAMDHGKNVLKAEAKASASALICKKRFDVYKYPIARWRWKINSVYSKGDERKKSGDDYPIRIYIIFKYNPDEATLFEKTKYNAARLFYGEYPPHSSLNYVWASRKEGSYVYTSPYTDRSKMIALERGSDKVNTWVDEEVDMLADYKKAFGKLPPAYASIAIMSDADNTGEEAQAFIDFIEIRGR